MGGREGYLTYDEFYQILDEHKLWQESEGKKGKRGSFAGLYLGNLDLSGNDLSGADFTRADLTEVRLGGAILRGAIFDYAVLIRADLSGADLSLAKMSNAALDAATLARATLVCADLREASLRQADLNKADLEKAELFRADLTGAFLQNASLMSACLREANLDWADLTGANLSHADLHEADFKDTILRKTKILSREDLINAKNISQSIIGFIFEDKEAEKIKQEREVRNENARETFVSGEIEYLTFHLPDTYGPIQVGRVLAILSFIYEGVRLALTSPFEDMDDLFRKAMAPEIYGTSNDEYRLRIESIVSGSTFGKLPGPKELVEAVGKIPEVVENFKGIKSKATIREEQAIATEEKKLALIEREQNIAKNQLVLKDQARELEHRRVLDELEKATILSDLASRDGVSEEARKKIDKIILNTFGNIDKVEDRSKIATEVVERGTKQLTVLRDNLGGGEFKAGDHYLLPWIKGDSDDIIEADDYIASVDNDDED